MKTTSIHQIENRINIRLITNIHNLMKTFITSIRKWFLTFIHWILGIMMNYKLEGNQKNSFLSCKKNEEMKIE